MTANFYSIGPSQDVAYLAAEFIRAQVDSARLSEAVVLVPNRRATITLRDAFAQLADGATVILPRIFSIADVGDELLALLGTDALDVLASIPAAMGEQERLCMLAAQVRAFEENRSVSGSLDYTMMLAENLAQLQDQCTRAGVAIGEGAIEALFPGDYAEHWRDSVLFLNIVAQSWPRIERELGQTTKAAREVAILQALAAHWQQSPPGYPVFAVGSTASQPATAQLLGAIAALPEGAVILPGIDLRMREEAWADVSIGHPYYFMKSLLDSQGLGLDDLKPIGPQAAHCSIWLHALSAVERMVHWKDESIAPQSWSHLRIIPCQHHEEEARIVALLMREALDGSSKRIALVTPNEALMARVQAHLQRYGVQANRTSSGTLGESEAGSLYLAMLEAMESPESVQKLIQLLNHPLVRVGGVDEWAAWRAQFEGSARGVMTQKPGQLPPLNAALREGKPYRAVEALARGLLDMSRQRFSVSLWVERLQNLLAPLVTQAGQGREPVQAALETLTAADLLGPVTSHDIAGLLRRALGEDWRAPQFHAHPQLFMLTPVEARLQHFDRVILGQMQEAIWPGTQSQGPWLNRAQQALLGLPAGEAHHGLVAHDILMLASGGEVFLTYPARDGGSPTARSRYIERLVTLLASHGVEENQLLAGSYKTISHGLNASRSYQPSAPPCPAPVDRPAAMAVSKLDAMFSDPYSLYARYVLELRKLDRVDAEPEPRDFGVIAHVMLQHLSEHWNEVGTPPDHAQMVEMVARALAPMGSRPAVQLFWQRRLMRALQFVNDEEATRRATGNMQVSAERNAKQDIALGGTTLSLHGRIDRLEVEGQNRRIIDYKTGKAPTTNEIAQGKAVQLLAYALMLGEQGASVQGLEYWALPAGKREGGMTLFAPEADLLEKLRAALAVFMDPATPLLAEPLPRKAKFESDYAGISRYDEWAS
jgi:ATP-dependent helicase/nuclease subunit B